MEDTLLLPPVLEMALLRVRPRRRGDTACGGCMQKKNSISGILAAYHISDRNDGRDDDDDEKRSKSYPSRTSWGGAFSLAEKFPFLFERRYGIAAYDYWWGYSSAQIDLMTIDQPLVVYPKDDDNKPKEHTQKKMDDFYERWAAKKKGTTMAGKKISLGDYLSNKI